MTDPLVSIVVATYNRSEVLASALGSIQGQTLGDYEVLVVGDGCTDDSAAVVRDLADPRFVWVPLPTNSGSQSAPNNHGMQLARGTYIALLGHDDLWLPWHLAELVAHREATGADLVHGLLAVYGRNGIVGVGGPAAARVPAAAHFAPPSSWLFRRSLVAEVGPWAAPESTAIPCDHEWLRRVRRAGCRVVCCPRLSAVKYPSAQFPGSYALRDPEPQASALAAIRADAAAFRLAVLTDIAVDHSRRIQETQWVTPVSWLLAARRFCRQRAAVWLEGTPLEGLARALFQRRRRRRRRERGLPAAPTQ